MSTALGIALWVAALGGFAAPEAASSATTVASRASLRGIVREAGDGGVIGRARVVIVPESTDRRAGPLRRRWHMSLHPSPAWSRQATTTADGTFVVDGLPSPRVRVIVIASGYDRLEQIVELPTRRDRPVTLFVVPQADNPYHTTVEAPPAAREPGRVATRELSPQEVATLPGTQGDPLRALQNLPGVARTPGGLGLLVLRGAAPNQSRVFYGEHALPRAFHVLALSTVMPADAIERIDFIPSNAPARYGDTTGGVVAIVPRRPPGDGLHGYGDIDLAGAAAQLRGPLGRGVFSIGAQRSWVDGVLGLFGSVVGLEFIRPQYSDYQGTVLVPTGSRGDLQVRVLGALDRIVVPDLSFDAPPDAPPSLRMGAQFHRVDLVVRRRLDAWRFLLTPSFRFERNAIERQGEPVAERDDFVTSWRFEADRRVSSRATLTVGVDGELDPYRTRDVTVEPDDPTGSSTQQVRRTRGVQSALGAYTTVDARFGALSLWPGVRVSTYTLGADAEAAVDPRVAGRWAIGDRWSWSFGAGLYSQPYIPQRTDGYGLFDAITNSLVPGVVLPAGFSQLEPRAGFAPQGDIVRVARAAQVSTNLGVRPGAAWALELGGYGRVRDHVAVPDLGGPARSPEAAASVEADTVSLDYGLELLVRRLSVRNLYGWLSYTLSRSQVRLLGAVPPGVSPRYPGSFDQRHILALVASYRLPRHFRVGGRFRLVSGSVFTDVVGVVDGPGGEFQRPIFGPVNGARFPTFHQLDLRVDKRWFRRRATMSLYLDVQNVYNRLNVEAYAYGLGNYHVRQSAVGLPIFPSLGFRVDW